MSDVKSHVKTIGSNVKSKAKVLGSNTMVHLKNMGAKRVNVAGRTVNPFLLGAVALALIGTTTYLLMKRRNKMQLAGHTGMEAQEYPVK